MDNRALGLLIGVLISMVFYSLVAYWTKRSCRTGYITIYVLYDGWSCAPGYKP